MRSKITKLLLHITFLIISPMLIAQTAGNYDAIYSGVPWFDDHGKIVSAHGANIVKDNGKYYLFGEAHTDTSNAFAGFNCYSSTDLYNWKFESTALPVQQSGKLGPNRVGERAKVMRCPETGMYVMYMHVDTLGYKDQFVGYATSNKITGPYLFQGALLFKGNPIKKWDMGTFQDKDGSGYVLIHGGEIYKLAGDYKSVSEQVNGNMTSGFESPTLFRKDDIYYLLGSHLTSWERNDNDYYTATSLKGPWTFRGPFAPKGSLTWNSQCTFVLPIEGSKDTTYLFMGDRWSFPKQASAATYVWQPLIVSENQISMPEYHEAWTLNSSTGTASPKEVAGKIIANNNKLLVYKGRWEHYSSADSGKLIRSAEKGTSFSVTFKGRQIGFHSFANPMNGYAAISLLNRKGKVMFSSIVDMYCKYDARALKFITPVLPKGEYTLTVSFMAERGNWSDKRKNNYGSAGNYITLDKVLIYE